MKKSSELSDTSYKSGIDDAECDPENDILLLEAILNSEPLSPLPNHADYFPEKKELKICEAKTNETSIDEPSSRAQNLPPPPRICIFRDDTSPSTLLKICECRGESALKKVLQFPQRAIAWIARIVKNSPAGVFIKSFTSSASFWESKHMLLSRNDESKKAKIKQIQARNGKDKIAQRSSIETKAGSFSQLPHTTSTLVFALSKEAQAASPRDEDFGYK
ncbi:hypothetical protein Tco_1319284 [Tanacetum coccineum]